MAVKPTHLLLVATLAALAFFAGRQVPSAGAAQDARPGESRADPAPAADASLAEVSRRLSQLEARLARQDAKAAARPAGDVTARLEQDDPSQLIDSTARQILDLEQQVNALPPGGSGEVALTWAIEEVLAGELGKSMGLSAANRHVSECRQEACFIRANYGDPGDADDSANMLAMELGSWLPRARTFVQPQPDGSYELVVVAMTESAAGSLGGSD